MSRLRQARQAGGLSQAEVGKAAGISKTSISRIERGQPPLADFIVTARVARMVGLNLSVRCFPAGGQLRDAGHVALIKRLVARLPSNLARQFEAPVRPGDLRAWDVLLQIGGLRIGVIAETRIRDLQALLRREHRKRVDSGIDRLLLLVADTRVRLRDAASDGATDSTSDAVGVLMVDVAAGAAQPVARIRAPMDPQRRNMASLPAPSPRHAGSEVLGRKAR